MITTVVDANNKVLAINVDGVQFPCYTYPQPGVTLEQQEAEVYRARVRVWWAEIIRTLTCVDPAEF